MTDCRCGRLTRGETFTVCETCGDELTQALNEVPWLTDELEITITGQRAIPTEGGPASSETRLPWHEKASGARTHLKAVLVSWALLCNEEGVRHQSPHMGLPDDNLPSIARWLVWRIDGLMQHELGPDVLDEITSAVADCRRMIDRRPDRWFAGPCDKCGSDLYARRGSGEVICHECSLAYDTAARREWLLASAEDHLATAATCARAVSQLGGEPVTRHRIAMWVKRGHLLAHGHDGRAPLYRIGDVLDIATRRQNAS